MTAEYPIQIDKFQLNNRREGEIMEVEFVLVCTSIHEHAGVALSCQIRWTHGWDLGHIKYANIKIHHKTNPHGIRAMGATYRIVSGSGRRIADNIWCEDLKHCAN